jgi:hypothetical protein
MHSCSVSQAKAADISHYASIAPQRSAMDFEKRCSGARQVLGAGKSRSQLDHCQAYASFSAANKKSVINERQLCNHQFLLILTTEYASGKVI